MKRLITLLSLSLFVLFVDAQSSFFVLVDVSKSIKSTDLQDAKKALYEVLNGSQLSKAFVAQGSQQDLANFRIVKGDNLAIARFGGLSNTLAINPKVNSIQNIPADIDQVLNSIPWGPTDDQTYLILAKAKIAEYAKNNKITKYKLLIISDNVQDDYGPGGKPNYPDDYTRNLAESYNTSNNPVNEAGFTKIKFTSNSLFTLAFSPGVDISKYSLPGGGSNAVGLDISQNIIITTFANGKKDKPKPTNSNSFTVSWSCNCEVGTVFIVQLIQVDGGKFKESKKVASNSITFSDIPSGEFKILISAPDVNSAITYIETPSSIFGWIIILVIVALGIGIGIYYWNKKRQEKIDVFTSNKSDDIFSGSKTKSGTTNISTNSDYF